MVTFRSAVRRTAKELKEGYTDRLPEEGDHPYAAWEFGNVNEKCGFPSCSAGGAAATSSSSLQRNTLTTELHAWLRDKSLAKIMG